MTTLNNDELRKQTIEELAEFHLHRLQEERPIDTVETLGPVARYIATNQIDKLLHSYGDTREIDGRIKEAEFLSYRLAVKHTDMSIVGKAFTSIMAFLKDRLAELKKMKGEV